MTFWLLVLMSISPVLTFFLESYVRTSFKKLFGWLSPKCLSFSRSKWNSSNLTFSIFLKMVVAYSYLNQEAEIILGSSSVSNRLYQFLLIWHLSNILETATTSPFLLLSPCPLWTGPAQQPAVLGWVSQEQSLGGSRKMGQGRGRRYKGRGFRPSASLSLIPQRCPWV